MLTRTHSLVPGTTMHLDESKIDQNNQCKIDQNNQHKMRSIVLKHYTVTLH